jgi:hypothetical protein
VEVTVQPDKAATKRIPASERPRLRPGGWPVAVRYLAADDRSDQVSVDGDKPKTAAPNPMDGEAGIVASAQAALRQLRDKDRFLPWLAIGIALAASGRCAPLRPRFRPGVAITALSGDG